jgi:hypothetical protein
MPNSVLDNHDDDFLLAWQYIHGTLPTECIEQFDARLQSDESLANQMIAAVRLAAAGSAIAAGLPGQSPRVLRAPATEIARERQPHRAIAVVAACAVWLLLLFNRPETQLDETVAQASSQHSVEYDVDDVSYQDLLDIYASDTFYMEAFEVNDDFDRAGLSGETADIEVPGWLFAALELGQEKGGRPQ